MKEKGEWQTAAEAIIADRKKANQVTYLILFNLPSLTYYIIVVNVRNGDPFPNIWMHQ